MVIVAAHRDVVARRAAAAGEHGRRCHRWCGERPGSVRMIFRSIVTPVSPAPGVWQSAWRTDRVVDEQRRRGRLVADPPAPFETGSAVVVAVSNALVGRSAGRGKLARKTPLRSAEGSPHRGVVGRSSETSRKYRVCGRSPRRWRSAACVRHPEGGERKHFAARAVGRPAWSRRSGVPELCTSGIEHVAGDAHQ
jgi:hypothetical protein